MRNKWSTTLPGAGYKVYIYTSNDHSAAKIYPTDSTQVAIQVVPQIIVPSSGLLEFWVDTNDYDLDQRFDIEIYDSIDNFWGAKKELNIFDISGYVLSKGTNTFSYTLENSIKIESGQCMSITLPPGKEMVLPDGLSLDIEDGGDLLIFSL